MDKKFPLFREKRLTVCGASMGGYIALKMLPFYDIKNIILFVPALYDARAFWSKFGSGFTQILREHDSWKHTDVVGNLETFFGNLLIYSGVDDNIIPRGVIELIEAHSFNAAKKEIISFEGCSHKIAYWLNEHPREKKRVAKKIAEYYFSSLYSRS